MYQQHKHASRPELVFHYFNMRGRGETARVICEYAGLDYKDNRVENWQETKKNYNGMRLPVLTVDGVNVDQSLPVFRYLANLAGLTGRTPFQAFQIDSIGETLNELRERLITAHVKDEEERKVKYEEFAKFGKEMLARLEKQFEKNERGQGFLVGSEISWADLHLFCVFEFLTTGIPDILNDVPLLKALFERIKELPKIAEYLKNRPQVAY